MSSDIHKDWQFHYDGLATGQLLIQRCTACGAHRFPPMPICSACLSRDWEKVQPKGVGRVLSYVICNRPAVKEGNPPVVGIIELEEGVSIVSHIEGIEPREVTFDMEVQVKVVATDSGENVLAARPEKQK